MRRDRTKCQTIMELTGLACGEPATEVDHVEPGDDHRDSNLAAICEWHHLRKSSAEGNAARRKKRREIDDRFRVVEQHPGLL